MNKGLIAIKNSLNELSNKGLLERVLYIKIPVGVDAVSKPPVIEAEKQLAAGHKSASNTARFPSCKW